jgi:hypothetical protein
MGVDEREHPDSAPNRTNWASSLSDCGSCARFGFVGPVRGRKKANLTGVRVAVALGLRSVATVTFAVG